MSEGKQIFTAYGETTVNGSKLHRALQHARSNFRAAGKQADGFGDKVEMALKKARKSVGKASGGRFPGGQWPNPRQTVFQQVHRAVDQYRAALDRGDFSTNLNVFKTCAPHSAAMQHLRSQFTGLSTAVMNWHMPAVDRINRDGIGDAGPPVDRGAETMKSLSAAMMAMAAEMKGLGERMAKGVPSVLG